MATITAVGATSWGTTLAIILARQGHDVRLLARTDAEARALQSARENARFVPGAKFPDTMRVLSDPIAACRSADLVMFVVPSQTLRANVSAVAHAVPADAIPLSAVKGIELTTGKRMSRIIEEELPNSQRGVCVLSGPNLAREIVNAMPASTVVASADADAAREAQRIINSSVFRVYTNDDVIGVELCGALKNIIAIAAGICDGMDFGDNSKATIITRGLAEITRLGAAAGANPATFAGLAGMGDLVATCASTLSRNHYVGEQLAAGRSLDAIRREMHSVAEGVDTTRAALDLAAKLNVEMPIAQGIHDIMHAGVSVTQAIQSLMGRQPTRE